MSIRPLLLSVLLLLLTPIARADPLHPLLPADTLAFLELDPSTAPAVNSPSALLDFGVQALQSAGILSKKAGEVADILALAAAAGQHHSCIALLDADLAVSPGSSDLECRSVQLAWVLDTAGQSADMVDRLTHLLSHLSTRSTALQSVHQSAEEKREYVEFRDTTWPAWLCLDWTHQGKLFILTLGAGAMDHYLADRTVGGVPWQQTVTDADAAAARQGATGEPFARIYVTPATFRQRFPEAMHRTQLGKLFATLDLFNTDASLFSTRIRGRAISMDNATESGGGVGGVTDVPWTVPLPEGSTLLQLVPPQATAYLALNVQWPALFTRFTALLDSIIPDDSGQHADQIINDFAAQHGVNIQTDILARLQPLILIHDAPPHPLRLPFMVTVVAAAEPPAQETVKKACTTLFSALATDLDRKAPAGHDLGGDFTHLRLRTDPDGITYLQFGLVGPAWTWVGNRFLFSWSPAAVRFNLPFAATAPPTAFTPAK